MPPSQIITIYYFLISPLSPILMCIRLLSCCIKFRKHKVKTIIIQILFVLNDIFLCYNVVIKYLAF